MVSDTDIGQAFAEPVVNSRDDMQLSGESFDADSEEGVKTSKPLIGTKDEFKILLVEKRRQQVSAVKTLESFGRYEQKYSMISNIFEKLFEIQTKAKQTIENSSYILGSDLPKDGQLLEALSHIIENCAFFGDIVLRVPDVSHRVLKADNKYEALYKWCISFSMASDLCDKNTIKMFDLLAQELSLVPKNESFINPYKKSNQKTKQNLKFNGNRVVTESDVNHQKKKQKTIKRGPRLTKSEL